MLPASTCESVSQQLQSAWPREQACDVLKPWDRRPGWEERGTLNSKLISETSWSLQCFPILTSQMAKLACDLLPSYLTPLICLSGTWTVRSLGHGLVRTMLSATGL